MKKDYEECIMELGGWEGFRLEDLKPCAFYSGPERRRVRRRKRPLRLYVKVIGFEDDHATVRNWGWKPGW